MKLTNPETIQESEKEFIDTINAELDWEAIEKMLLEKHNFTLQEEVEYKDGDLVVYKDNIAYKFDFEIKVPISVIFNREGECLDISSVRDDEDDEDGFEDDLDHQDILDDELEEDLADDEADEDELLIDADLGDSDQDDILPSGPEDKVSKMTSDLADMISEINEGDE